VARPEVLDEFGAFFARGIGEAQDAGPGAVHRDDALRERAQQCLTILERALKQTA
jgi:hypothetical protein